MMYSEEGNLATYKLNSNIYFEELLGPSVWRFVNHVLCEIKNPKFQACPVSKNGDKFFLKIC